MAEKLMLEIDLRESVAEPNRSVTLESLAYLSRASLEDGTLEDLAELVFTGGRVREGLEALLLKPNAAFRKVIEQAIGQAVEQDRLDRVLANVAIVQKPYKAKHGPAAGPVVAGGPTAPEAKPAYSRQYHLQGKPKAIADLFDQLNDRLLTLGDVQVTYTKMYVNFSAPKHSFITVVLGRDKMYLYFSIPWTESPKPRLDRMRDVAKIGHYGMGDTEFVLSGIDQLDDALVLATSAFERNRPKS